MAKDELSAAIKELGLTLEMKFIPFSQSRNAKQNATVFERSLNWRVTLKRNDRDILTTDYNAGIARCPSYVPRPTVAQAEKIEAETETGKSHRGFRTAIMPDRLDIIASLVIDANVLDYSSFEEWAENFGYDTDSRKAEQTYRACLEIGLKLRNGLGEDGLTKLREASQDY